MNSLVPAEQPTIYFIGVTTGKSSIMKIYPWWAACLGLKYTQIKGIDLKIHDEPKAYRDVVKFIKEDPLSMGALVTTHKIDLYNACKDMFDYIDPYATMLGEVSSISKNEKGLAGHAKDPISSGLAMEDFLKPNYWKETDAEVLVLGAGGSAVAFTSYLMQEKHLDNVPSRIIVCNRSLPRLEEIIGIHETLKTMSIRNYHLTPTPEEADTVMNSLKPYSLVVNATGLGKDRPGSPITDKAIFPEKGIAWDFNYRGNLLFLKQAKAQVYERNLRIEDGWIYFIHGWTQVIFEVFHLDVDKPKFEELVKIAHSFYGSL
jgi:shikimate 5-dehydrogenase